MANVPTGDPRSEFYKDCFSKALPFAEYVQTGDDSQQQRWNGYKERIKLSDQACSVTASFQRKMHLLVLSGVWCGDCMRQGPMLEAIAASNPMIESRYIDNHAVPELRDMLRVQGGTRVPVALFLSEDFFEVARFGDRTLGAYRRKSERELGPACDAGLVPAADSELEQELLEWLDQFERAQLILRLSPMLRKRHDD